MSSLLALVVQGFVDKSPDRAQDSMDMVVHHMLNNLLDRALYAPSFQDVDLDGTTLGKSGCPSRRSCSCSESVATIQVSPNCCRCCEQLSTQTSRSEPTRLLASRTGFQRGEARGFEGLPDLRGATPGGAEEDIFGDRVKAVNGDGNPGNDGSWLKWDECMKQCRAEPLYNVYSRMNPDGGMPGGYNGKPLEVPRTENVYGYPQTWVTTNEDGEKIEPQGPPEMLKYHYAKMKEQEDEAPPWEKPNTPDQPDYIVNGHPQHPDGRLRKTDAQGNSGTAMSWSVGGIDYYKAKRPDGGFEIKSRTYEEKGYPRVNTEEGNPAGAGQASHIHDREYVGKSYEEEFPFEMKRIMTASDDRERNRGNWAYEQTYRNMYGKVLPGYNRPVYGLTAEERLDLRVAAKSDPRCL